MSSGFLAMLLSLVVAGVTSCGSAPTCADGLRNGTETDVDCGGTCDPCAPGQGCAITSDCNGGACSGLVCHGPTCTDALKDGPETDVDCGGSCAPCAATRACAVAKDCASGVCTGRLCQAPTCQDGVKNGTETDRDCGGPCSPCAVKQACAANSDCATSVCTSSVCLAATCNDGIKNGDETALDCGGSCMPCAATQACAVMSDCASGVCTGQVCQGPMCNDGVKNGDETDLDCGGSCSPCALGKGCLKAADCATSSCAAATCTNPTSCADLHAQAGGLQSGAYSIDPDGSGPLPAVMVYCDMSLGFTFRVGAQVQNDYASISSGCSGGLQPFQVRSAAHAAAMKQYAMLTSRNNTWYYGNFFAGPLQDCTQGSAPRAGYLTGAASWVSSNLTESTLSPLNFSTNCNNQSTWDPVPLNDTQGYADYGGGTTVLYNSTETILKGYSICSVNDVP